MVSKNGERLFGFDIVKSNVLCLFLLAIGIIFIGFNLLFVMLEDYSYDNDPIPIELVVIFGVIIAFGVYILYKTQKYRRNIQ